MFMGQLWVNTIPYCSWMTDSGLDFIELCCSNDCESEEEQSKKEKDDKVQVDLYTANVDISMFMVQTFHFRGFVSIHAPEITTPPPEYLF